MPLKNRPKERLNPVWIPQFIFDLPTKELSTAAGLHYHPDQHSSASIKKVLPAFTGLSYDGMAIGNGQEASQKYLDFMQGKLTDDEIEGLWQGLIAYCGLDTLAMKALLDILFKYGNLSKLDKLTER